MKIKSEIFYYEKNTTQKLYRLKKKKLTDRYNIMDMLSCMRNLTLNYSVIFIVKIGLRYCIYNVCDCDHT